MPWFALTPACRSGVLVGQRAGPPPRWVCLLDIGVGREGGLAGGRRESVHGGSVAPSMALTPPANPPSRPGTVYRHRGKDQKEQEQKPLLQAFVSTKVDIYQSRTGVRSRAVPADRGKLSGVGRCGLAGPQAPWMAPTSPHGRVYGVSCKPTPPRPTLSKPAFDVDVEGAGQRPALPLRRVQGCKPCRNPTPFNRPQPPARASAPATPAATPTPPATHRRTESPHTPGPR